LDKDAQEYASMPASDRNVVFPRMSPGGKPGELK